MSIYRRDVVSPEWEPAPWPMGQKAADEQELGFHERALKSIRWRAIPWDDFPTGGIFDRDKDWFASVDAAFFASIDGEDLILIQNIWFGFPDPPEWGLASRPGGQSAATWARWGHFPYLPEAWALPAP